MVTPPSGISYGFFTLSDSLDTGTATSLFPGLTFDLVVNDVSNGMSTTFVGTSNSGPVSSTSTDSINFTFTPVSASLGNDTFFVYGPVLVVAPSTNGGVSSIQGSVLQSTVRGDTPEPASLLLLVSGLVFLYSRYSRRKLAR